MTPEQYKQSRPIFLVACELQGEERIAYLNQVCGDDADMRARVEEMLYGHDSPVDLVNTTGLQSQMQAYFSGDECAVRDSSLPKAIGEFRIIRKIGEGGMGSVYEAEQSSPKRTVALKMIRPGFNSNDIVRRFQREIDLLGRLDHPGIARIFYAGMSDTETGRRPYFTMELINGQSLLKYCEQRKLRTTKRIELFAAICDAVHYAHMRGVVHRDLKPGNILVTENGRPVILDFGIARVTHSDIQATTLTVNDRQILGTLAYMSPEQAAGQADLVDACSDVYSLGVVLYELLTGKLPYDISNKSIADAALTIREETPTKLSRIDRTLRGDIETIVFKSMSKDPGLRYDSAAALAQDLRRFLADEPIIARPPSAIYEIRKFAKRNKGLVGTAAFATVSLVAMTIFATNKAVSATESRNAAEIEADRAKSAVAFLSDVLSSVNPDRLQGEETKVRSVLDEAASRLERGDMSQHPATQAQLHSTIGRSYLMLGIYDASERHLTEALDLNRSLFGDTNGNVADSLDYLARAKALMGKFDVAEDHYLEAKSIRSRIPELKDDMGRAWPHSLAEIYRATGRYDEAESLYREAVGRCRDLGLKEKLAQSLSGLGAVFEVESKYPEAIQAHSEAVTIYEELFGEFNTDLANTFNNLGNAYQAAGQYQNAFESHQQALAIRKTLLRPDHLDIALTYANLALVLVNLERFAESESMTREAMKIRDSQLPPIHHMRAAALNNLGKAVLSQDRAEEALGYFDRAVEQAEGALPEGHLMTLVLRSNRADCLRVLGKYEEAEGELLSCYERVTSSFGAKHRRAQNIAAQIVKLYEELEMPDKALAWSMKITD